MRDSGLGADLSNEEIDLICDGLKQNAAKVRYLENLGLTVKRKPNGRPLVNRKHYDAVRGVSGSDTTKARSSEPNWSR